VSPKIIQEAIIPEATTQVLLDRIEVLTKNLVFHLPRFLQILKLLGEIIKEIQISGIYGVFENHVVNTLFNRYAPNVKNMLDSVMIYQTDTDEFASGVQLSHLVAKIIELLEVINSLQTLDDVRKYIQELKWKIFSDRAESELSLPIINAEIFTMSPDDIRSEIPYSDEKYLSKMKHCHREHVLFWMAMLFVLAILLEKEKYLEEENEKEENVEELADNDAEYDQFEPDESRNKSPNKSRNKSPKKNSKKSSRDHPNKSR
jgi:hypothetical protein